MKKYVIAAIVVAALALSACGTVRGFGQDVQTVGTWVENAGKPKVEQ